MTHLIADQRDAILTITASFTQSHCPNLALNLLLDFGSSVILLITKMEMFLAY